MTHAGLERMHVPVGSDGVAEVVSVELSEELSHLIKSLISLNLAAAETSNRYLHRQDHQ